MFDFLREACDRNCDQSALRTTNLIDYDDVFKVDHGDNVVVVDVDVEDVSLAVEVEDVPVEVACDDVTVDDATNRATRTGFKRVDAGVVTDVDAVTDVDVVATDVDVVEFRLVSFCHSS